MAKGWNRASFDMNVRPDKVVRNISQQHLLVPSMADGASSSCWHFARPAGS
jgi:hypothetical protein